VANIFHGDRVGEQCEIFLVKINKYKPEKAFSAISNACYGELFAGGENSLTKFEPLFII